MSLQSHVVGNESVSVSFEPSDGGPIFFDDCVSVSFISGDIVSG